MKFSYYIQKSNKKWILFLLFIMPLLSLTAQTYTKEEQLYWYSQLWKDVSNHFYDPEHLQRINWDSLYIANMKRIPEIRNDLDYYRLLEKSIAVLNDGHTNLSFNDWSFSDDFNIDYLPIEIQSIGENYYVFGVWKEKAVEIPLCSKVLKVNGKPTSEYLQEYIFPYVPGHTIQDKRQKALSYLTIGTAQDSIVFTIQTPQGKILETTLQYVVKRNNITLKRDMVILSQFISFGQTTDMYLADDPLGSKYYRLRLDGFQKNNITGLIKEIAEEVSEADYIILDLRNNGGGNEEEADTLLACFLNTDTLITYPSVTRTNDAYYAAMGYGFSEYKNYYDNLSMRKLPLDTLIKKDLPLFTQPLFILTSAKTYSAAEDFLITLKLHYPDRAILVGSPTGGSTGAPFVRKLPYHNAYYRICVRHPLLPEGMFDKGIQPDYLYEPDIEELIENQDLIYNYIANLFLNLKKDFYETK